MIKSGKVTLLDSIVVDRSLLKYKKEGEQTKYVSNFNGSGSFEPTEEEDGDNEFPNNRISIPVNPPGLRTTSLDYLEYLYMHRPTLFLGFKIFLFKKLYSKDLDLEKRNEKEIISTTGLKQFFEDLKKSVSDLDKSNI